MNKDTKTEVKINSIKSIKELQKKENSKNKKNLVQSSSPSHFFSRFGLMIAIVITLCGLIMAVVALNDIMQQPYADTTSQNQLTGSGSGHMIDIDQVTIDKYNSLKTSANNTNQELPTNRINPFNG